MFQDLSMPSIDALAVLFGRLVSRTFPSRDDNSACRSHVMCIQRCNLPYRHGKASNISPSSVRILTCTIINSKVQALTYFACDEADDQVQERYDDTVGDLRTKHKHTFFGA